MLRRSDLDSFSRLAKRLDVDDQTIRNTMKRMQVSGFLKNWSIIVNPHVFNMEAASIILESQKGGSRVKNEILSQLKLIDGVAIIFQFLDGLGFRVILYYIDEKDLQRKIQLLSAVCSTNRQPRAWKLVYPPIKKELKRTDWQILGLLLRNSRENTSRMAASIGVSGRTIRRRLAILTLNRAFFVDPIVDFKRLDGFLHLFVVSFSSKTEKTLADQSLLQTPDAFIFIDTTAESYTVLAAICQNISQASRISGRLRLLKGVKKIMSKIVEDRILVHDWLEHEIETRVKI
jgi:DNA-binding Lrp family transcriptional regulator